LNTSEYPVIAEGGITKIQWDWLDCELARATAEHRLIVVLNHHRSDNLDQIVDTEAPGSPKLCDTPATCSAMMVERLHQYPNVILHLVGHGHENLVIARDGATPEAGYWEVETSAIIDWPEQTRILEIVTYPNGVGELWSTMLDHAPLSRSADVNTLSELARALGADDAVRQPSGALGGEGTPDDRNRVLRFAIPTDVAATLAPGNGVITSRDAFALGPR
ncbi:MAG: hypothetical protein KC466_08895, partial [Myxococcales bacterium]|nr:hypothetical protein [Myxococcales bacterium]